MSSLDLWQELRGTESAGRLTGREHRLKDPGRIDARVAEDVRVKGRTVDEALAERSFPLYARLRSAEPDDETRAELQALSRALCWSGPVLADRPFRLGGLAHRVAYYAIIDALSSRESPAAVLRRVMHPDGQRDEAFGHDLAWRHTFLLYSAERGNLDNKLRQISGIEAARIVGRVRAAAAAAAS